MKEIRNEIEKLKKVAEDGLTHHSTLEERDECMECQMKVGKKEGAQIGLSIVLQYEDNASEAVQQKINQIEQQLQTMLEHHGSVEEQENCRLCNILKGQKKGLQRVSGILASKQQMQHIQVQEENDDEADDK